MDFQKVGIAGAGAWGTGLAQAVRRAGRDVLIWGHRAQTVAAINQTGQNQNYLPGIKLDAAIRATGDLAEIATRDVVLLVTPAQHTRAVARQLAATLAPGCPAILCAKGIEQTTRLLMADVLAEALPQACPAVLSGPSFAGEVARNLPAALTLACVDERLGARLARALGHANFWLYWTGDMIGAQIGGAIKNVLAIAAGIVAGKQLGANAHAALTARGFAEMTKFGTALGARPETLTGLSGLGDLLLTCGNRQSRNMSLGIKLGQGEPLNQVLVVRIYRFVPLEFLLMDKIILTFEIVRLACPPRRWGLKCQVLSTSGTTHGHRRGIFRVSCRRNRGPKQSRSANLHCRPCDCFRYGRS